MGLLYGVVLAVLGFAVSGGGHSNLMLMLALAPYGAGILLWPIFGILISDLRSAWSRRIFLLVMLISLWWVSFVSLSVLGKRNPLAPRRQ
jgi:hypothetical protein